MAVSSPESSTVYVVRNEVDPACEYHCDAVAEHVPTAEEIDYAAGDRVPLDEAAAVVLTGSTAGVYESDDRGWITEQEALVRDLVDRGIPTLGICFGHQVANSALGGTVEHVGRTATLVEVELADDPVFAGVEPVVVSLHSDVVTEPGDDMDVVASADHARVFGTAHRTAPLWTVQFHPEITAAHHDTLVEDFGWEPDEYSFEDVTAGRLFENFLNLAVDKT